MTAASRLLTIAAGYISGVAVLVWGTYLFWVPGLSQEQVLLTGFPIMGGIGLMAATAEFQSRSAARSV